jgi:RHS repeat-associated protein
MTDVDGRLVWRGRYSTWGKVSFESITAHTPRGFTQNLRMQGQYEDKEIDLCYNTFRYYDPDIGRFTTEDPIGLLGGINLYQYAPNPLAWIDPWGWACGGGGKGDKPNSLPGPKLPKNIASTFKDGAYKNRQLSESEAFYKYHGVDNRTGRKFSWLTNKEYSSESELRSDLAIRRDWGVKTTEVSEFKVPSGTWVSEGIAAPQGAGYPGGGYQAVVTNVPKVWVVKTTGVPW